MTTKTAPTVGQDGKPKTRRCSTCGQPALFITPVGLLCRDHAMAATLDQPKGDDRWMPVPLSDSIPD